jgi:hypothetical protein
VESKALNQSPGESYAGDSQHESSNPQLRRALQAIFESAGLQQADSSNSQQSDLRASLRQVSTDARHAGLRAEQLLVLIKDVWSTLPASVARVPSVHGDERLNYVISTCVDEYYGHIPGDHEGSP